MKSKKKKPAKTITLLTRIETLLADVLNDLSTIEKSVEKNVKALLVAAEASISQAKDFITPSPAVRPGHRAVRVRPRATRAKVKGAVRGRRISAAHG